MRVQNRRFLRLGASRCLNLATRALALAVQALPQAWAQANGYRPVLAETFTDLECFHGTCYKAAGWLPVGQSRGFAQHRADYYHRHGQPKKLWLCPLHHNARQLLTALDLPHAYAPALNLDTADRALPLRAGQVESLHEALRAVPDPRAPTRLFSCASLLTLVALGLLAGRKHLAVIQRFGQFLTQPQRARLGWPLKPGTRFRKAPSYSALYNLLCQLDPHALALVLNGWVAAPASSEAQAEGELTAARRLYRQTELNGALVTADALHCEPQTMRVIVEAGGDYLLALKANPSTALERAQAVATTHSPLLPASR